jgi:small subunit ribosomal protein S15
LHAQIKKFEMQVTSEVKKTIFKTYGGSDKNTGSTEAQIALYTERINHMSGHLETNRKDHSNTRSLLRLVGRRRRLLNYLMKQDLAGYRILIDKLGIRK